MTDDIKMPKEVEVALSYLDDVDEQIQRSIKTETRNVLIRAQAAQEIQRGDLALAHRELDKLQAAGTEPDAVAATRATAFFREGNLAWAVATSGGPDTGDQTKWLKKTAEAFEKSVQLSPTAAALYNLGLAYKLLNRKSSAVEAFRRAEQMGDPQLAMEAHKEITRLDPSGRMAAAPSASRVAGAGHAVVGPRKKPHWGFVGWGSCACSSPGSIQSSSCWERLWWPGARSRAGPVRVRPAERAKGGAASPAFVALPFERVASSRRSLRCLGRSSTVEGQRAPEKALLLSGKSFRSLTRRRNVPVHCDRPGSTYAGAKGRQAESCTGQGVLADRASGG